MLSLYVKYQNFKNRLTQEEEGQTIVEYALLIVLVALAIAAANPSLTSAIKGVFGKTSSVLGYVP
jgi:Flp pilus assembly pilin Flp